MDDQVYSLAHELAEVGRLSEDENVTMVLERLVGRAVRTIPGCDHVTITVGVEEKVETVAGAEATSLCHSLSEATPWPGPILEAVRYREPRRVDDADTEQRWPGFSDRMREAGFRSCLALPMPVRRQPLVGFTLFSRRAHQFTDQALDLVLLFALHAGTAFDNASLYDDARQLIDHLHSALATREAIGQAQGILMRRFSCDANTAFGQLRRISQDRNIKLREVALNMVDAQKHGKLDSFLPDWLNYRAAAQ